VQDRSVACSYMPVGMKGCGFKVLSAVSVAVRHSLTGDRNEGTSCYKPQRFEQEGPYPLLLCAQVTYRLAEATRSRFRAIDRQLLKCGSVSCTGAGDLVGWFGHTVQQPMSPHFRNLFSSGKLLYIVTRFITFLCFWHIIPV